MRRLSLLAAIAAIATTGVLVGAALVGVPARATPSSGVTTTILAKSIFDEIKVNAHTHTPDLWNARGRHDAVTVLVANMTEQKLKWGRGGRGPRESADAADGMILPPRDVRDVFAALPIARLAARWSCGAA